MIQGAAAPASLTANLKTVEILSAALLRPKRSKSEASGGLLPRRNKIWGRAIYPKFNFLFLHRNNITVTN